MPALCRAGLSAARTACRAGLAVVRTMSGWSCCSPHHVRPVSLLPAPGIHRKV